MRTHGCLPVVTLLIGLVTGATAAPGELPAAPETGLLIAGHEALADVQELCAVVTTFEDRRMGSLLDLPQLRTQVIAQMGLAGIRHVECKTGLTPRLVVGIEGVAVPDCNSYVVRVQTSLRRVVTFATDGDRHVQAEVWRLRPVMKVVPKESVSDAIGATVVTQAEAFAGAYRAAQRLRPRAAEPKSADPGNAAPRDVKEAASEAPFSHPFVASRSSAVFHRADCRWAQNIAAHNRVGYRTREEAVQDGKRPCKSCKP
ncbi:MAG: hypothetical protein JW741_07290 [Sedimentisphaerales bacterium]|nr:hypothetical protein [Sedimentisphaerales bacterium]